MAEIILSAGIDIGTTTTQLIFSRLTMERTGGFGTVPKIEVTDRQVIYRSRIYLTPLTDEDTIDAAQTARLIEDEYRIAGVKPEDLGTGAVIITGESARKRNAREVAMAIAGLAGEFVVAAAGPDLESSLAGKGAGADRLSAETGRSVLNLDIGGGTSNLCFFEDGVQTDCACFDIGGRVIRLDARRRVEHITPKVEELLSEHGIGLKPGEELTEETGERIAELLAEILAEGANLKPAGETAERFVTNHGLRKESVPSILSFSGGVADCMEEDEKDLFAFGDIGVFLGRAIRKLPVWNCTEHAKARETMRATVIGAGSCSMEVSGSTVFCRNAEFPLKNIPVQRVGCAVQSQIDRLDMRLAALKEQRTETFQKGFAVAMDGPACPTFAQVEAMARALAEILTEERHVTPLILEHDFAKALGQALRRRVPERTPILCLDGISCRNGDFIDIGKPVGQGTAFPVIVKTLVFSGNGRKES